MNIYLCFNGRFAADSGLPVPLCFSSSNLFWKRIFGVQVAQVFL